MRHRKIIAIAAGLIIGTFAVPGCGFESAGSDRGGSTFGSAPFDDKNGDLTEVDGGVATTIDAGSDSGVGSIDAGIDASVDAEPDAGPGHGDDDDDHGPGHGPGHGHCGHGPGMGPGGHGMGPGPAMEPGDDDCD